MAFTFATRCLNCSRVLDLPADSVQVTIYAGRTFWAYRCPLCHSWVDRPATECQQAAFTYAGLVARKVGPPEPPLIEGRAPVGAAINEDDVERFSREIGALADG